MLSNRNCRECVLLVLALASLAVDGVNGQLPSTRDSAGIRIVENPARASASVTFRLSLTPSLDIGGAESDPDLEFAANQGYLRGVRLADGGLVAIDVVRVQFFDSRGARRRIAGRSGAGPEEFLYLTSICRTRGDTVVVSDSRNGRLAILDGRGSIVKTVRTGELGTPPFNACLDDGTVLLERSMPAAPGVRRQTRISRVRLDGTTVNTVGTFAFPPFDMITQSEPTVLGWNQRIYIGDPTRSEIRIYNPTGQLLTIIRSADVPVRISDSEAEARMRSAIPNNVSTAEVGERMTRMRSQPRPPSWPAYRRMHVDPRGTLWVQDYIITRPAPDAWSAFDSNGRLMGRLIMPEPSSGQRRLEVISFGVDEVLVRRQDADGFAHLTAYPIQRVRP